MVNKGRADPALLVRAHDRQWAEDLDLDWGPVKIGVRAGARKSTEGRQKLESAAVAGNDDLEVLAVDRRDLGRAQVFRCSDHHGVDCVERKIGVAPHQLGSAMELVSLVDGGDEYTGVDNYHRSGSPNSSRRIRDERSARSRSPSMIPMNDKRRPMEKALGEGFSEGLSLVAGTGFEPVTSGL